MSFEDYVEKEKELTERFLTEANADSRTVGDVTPATLLDGSQDRRRQLTAYGIHTASTLAEAVKSQSHEPYLVDGLLRMRSVNLLVGDSGLGKTPLGIQLGICVSAGLPFLDLQLRRGRVLYCDGESDLFGFEEMLRTISGFLGLPEVPPDFHVWSPNWDWHLNMSEAASSAATKLTARVQLLEPTLVIVDPLRVFWPQAESGSEEAMKMIQRFRELSRPSGIGCSWLITHHRRKVNQLAAVANLEHNPQEWFQEAAGSLALVNQSDTRIGVMPHAGRADLLVAGFVRGIGPFEPLDLGRVTDKADTPIGYQRMRGVQLLNDNDRALFDGLTHRFRFKHVQEAMGGTSASNANRFLRKCNSLLIAKKDGNEYVKTVSVMECVK
jgi:hypothetical protein